MVLLELTLGWSIFRCLTRYLEYFIKTSLEAQTSKTYGFHPRVLEPMFHFISYKLFKCQALSYFENIMCLRALVAIAYDFLVEMFINP